MKYFNGEKSLNLRIWHWLNFIVILGLMFTYIFRETWFNKSENAFKIQNKLFEFGIELSNDQSIIIAKLIRENMWNWHYIFGFVLVFLLIMRIFSLKSKNENNLLKKIKESNNFKYKSVKFIHLLFYFITFYVCVSGLIIYFRADLNIEKESLKLVKELHAYSFWFFLVFIIFHIIGVIKAEITTDKGLISEMFNGGKNK